MNVRRTNFVVALTALLIALLAAELGARQWLPAPQQVHITADQKPFQQQAHIQTLSLSEHPDEGGVYRGTPSGRRLRPNRSITIHNHRLSQQQVVIETNSLGYRNPELGPKQGTRILFLGDSVTFQDYLNEEDTFVRRIEQQASAQGLNWETINAGVGAISLKTELAILQESGLSLAPDVVVLGFYLNDFQDSKGVHVLTLPWHLEKSYFLYHLTMALNQWRGRHLQESEINTDAWKASFAAENPVAKGFFNESPAAFNQMILDAFHDYGAIWSDEAWDQLTPLFAELKRLSDDHHFKLVIVAFPVYQQVYTEFLDDRPQQQLQKLANSLNIPVLDTLPILRQEALQLHGPSIYAGQTLYHDLFFDQCHHTARGSALLADEIFEFLHGLLEHP